MSLVSYKRNKPDSTEIYLKKPALQQALVYPHVYLAKHPIKPTVEIPPNSKVLREAT
jgi:hypothetical protein